MGVTCIFPHSRPASPSPAIWDRHRYSWTSGAAGLRGSGRWASPSPAICVRGRGLGGLCLGWPGRASAGTRGGVHSCHVLAPDTLALSQSLDCSALSVVADISGTLEAPLLCDWVCLPSLLRAEDPEHRSTCPGISREPWCWGVPLQFRVRLAGDYVPGARRPVVAGGSCHARVPGFSCRKLRGLSGVGTLGLQELLCTLGCCFWPPDLSAPVSGRSGSCWVLGAAVDLRLAALLREAN